MARRQRHFYELGPFQLDVDTRVLERDGKLVPLSPNAARLLLILAENTGQFVQGDDLMKRVWPDTFVGNASIYQLIRAIRVVLKEGSNGTECIENVPKRGYRLLV